MTQRRDDRQRWKRRVLGGTFGLVAGLAALGASPLAPHLAVPPTRPGFAAPALGGLVGVFARARAPWPREWQAAPPPAWQPTWPAPFARTQGPDRASYRPRLLGLQRHANGVYRLTREPAAWERRFLPANVAFMPPRPSDLH